MKRTLFFSMAILSLVAYFAGRYSSALGEGRLPNLVPVTATPGVPTALPSATPTPIPLGTTWMALNPSCTSCATGQVTLAPAMTTTDSPASPAAGTPVATRARPTARPATGAHVAYVVQPGETLSGIAYAYGIDLDTLLAYNGLQNPDLVYAGSEIQIPLPGDATAAPSPGGPKRIVVDISQQRAYAYEGDTLVYKFIVSTGEPGRETARGTFSVLNKIPMAYASTWNLKMPYWLGIYWAGPLQDGFHALPILPDGSRLWEGNLGRPVSYGCIILSTADARTLYNWAEIGTKVVIQD
jgi:lipoprotein-anchoring transpeptidase ErfK/SrfK